MKLVAIESAAFGTLKVEEPLQLQPGLNVVVAANQSGKSTLLTMIEWVLYGVPARGSKRNLALMEQWSPWDRSAPQASLLIAPEREGWPESVRVQVYFDRFSIFLQDLQTLDNISEMVEVSSNGEWDLGTRLTGLSRGAFLASVLARQGRTDEILGESGLRAMLTADLAGLVEDPDKATLDASLKQLEAPSFTMAGLAESPVLFGTILRRAEEQQASARRRAEAGREHMAEMERLNARREQAELRLNEEHARRDKVLRRMKDIDLSTARWSHAQRGRAQGHLAGWQDRLEGEPWLRDFPFDLELEIERWRSDIGNLREREEQLRAKLREARDLQLRMEKELIGSEQVIPLVDRQDDIRTHAARLDAAIEDAREAQQEKEDREKNTDPELRARYEELDRGLRRHRSYLNTLLDWHARQQEQESRKAELEHRRLLLAPMLRRRSGGSRALAILLMIAALVLGTFSVVSPRALEFLGSNSSIIGMAAAAVLMLIGISLLVRVLQVQRQSRRAIGQMEKEIRPALTEIAEAQTRMDEERRRLILKYGLTDEKWKELMRDLPVYKDLRFRLEGYAMAGHQLAEALEKQGECWQKLSLVMPGMPVQIDREWLEERMRQIAHVEEQGRLRIEAKRAQHEAGRDIDEMQARISAQLERLADMLEPVGLGYVAGTNPDDAIASFRQMKEQAREFQKVEGELRELEEVHRHAVMPRSEFELAWEKLSAEERERLEQMVGSAAELDGLLDERRKLDDYLERISSQGTEAAGELASLRERIAAGSEAMGNAEQAARDLAEANARLERLRTWQRALELCSGQLAGIRSSQSSSLAPRVNDELQRILESAPVGGLLEARVDNDLSLRLRLADAPAELGGQALLERLSSGARSQLGLAMRSAVVRALTGTVNAPLLLDEPLADLDDMRSVESLRYLDTLSGHHQVLLTSCHRAQFEWLLHEAGLNAGIIGV